MAIIITNQANTIKFDLGNSEEYHLDKDNLSIKKKFGFVHIYGNPDDSKKFTKLKFKYTDVSSPVLASNTELVNLLLGYKVNTGVTVGNVLITDDTGNIMTLEPNGSIPVTLQDQTTPVVIEPFSHLLQATTISAPVAVGDKTVTLVSVTDVSAGKILTFFNPTSVRFMYARCVGAPVGNVVTLDRFFDFAYPAGSYCDVSDANLTVNGSVTPVLYGIRNNAGAVPPPGIELTLDVTRIIFQCITTALPELDMFGDIAGGLLNGLHVRRRDGEYYNIFNAQTNGEIAGITYDFSVYEAAKFGVNGFISRLTFAGQNKMGVAIRLAINEDMEIIVQDDLSSLLRFTIVAEGSIVQP